MTGKPAKKPWTRTRRVGKIEAGRYCWSKQAVAQGRVVKSVAKVVPPRTRRKVLVSVPSKLYQRYRSAVFLRSHSPDQAHFELN